MNWSRFFGLIIRVLLVGIALTSHAMADATLCRSVFVGGTSVFKSPFLAQVTTIQDRLQIPVQTWSKQTGQLDARPSIESLIARHDLRDQYGNSWQVHPEYDFLRLVSATDDLQHPLSKKLFLQLVSALHSEHYVRKIDSIRERKQLRRVLARSPYLRQLLLKSETGDVAAYFQLELVLGSKVYSLLDLNLKTRLGGRIDHDDWWRLEDYMRFLLKLYRDRLGLSEEQSLVLDGITRRLIDRTTLLHVNSVEIQGGAVPKDLGLNSGLILVESRNQSEPIPWGILHHQDIRDLLPEMKDGGIVEVGRFGKEGAADKTIDLLQLALVSIAARPHVEFVVIEVDRVRRRMWEPLGFKELKLPAHLQRGEYYKSGTDILLYAKVQDLMQTILPASKDAGAIDP